MKTKGVRKLIIYKSHFNKFLMLVLAVLLVIFYYGASNAIDKPIKWRRPVYTHDSEYVVKRFISSKYGFEMFIEKSKGYTFWHIQIISKYPLEISSRAYLIRFEVNSNKNFTLYSRLGEEDITRGNSYVDHPWEIFGDGRWHKCSLDFKGHRGNNFLYFQPGHAPSGTLLKIRNITVKQLD